MAKGLALVLVPLALAALVAVPVLIDQPFGTQTDWTMAAAFAMRRWSPLVTLLGALAVAAVVATSWRRWRGPVVRIGMVVSCAVTLAAVWSARQNPFEWMFNPLDQPRYVRAADATFVDDADLVLAVHIEDDAAAYPIRQLAYHHLVNDRIGLTPAVVTY
jgi:hypothetical protein